MSKDFIFKREKCLTKEQCKTIIEHFENSKKIVTQRNYLLVPGFSCGDVNRDTFSFLFKSLQGPFVEYCEEYSFLKKLYYPWGLDGLYNIQKYEPGNSYPGEHMEHGNVDPDQRRILAWMIYLNDIHDDGGTCWPQQNFTATPREGDLYIWPAGWTHSHYGIVSNTETKYIMTGWCSLYPG